MSIAFNRYYEANIPISYWPLEMKDFKGPDELAKLYEHVSTNIDEAYKIGASICIAGTNGVGKTFTVCSLLKKACQKNYTCLYTTLTDIVDAIVSSPYDDRYNVKKELLGVDFLAIDEVDPKYVNTEAKSELFGAAFEHILRTRSQNKLPIILCTNSPNPVETFSGIIKTSIDSLWAKVKMVSVMGKDYRKIK